LAYLRLTFYEATIASDVVNESHARCSDNLKSQNMACDMLEELNLQL